MNMRSRNYKFLQQVSCLQSVSSGMRTLRFNKRVLLTAFYSFLVSNCGSSSKPKPLAPPPAGPSYLVSPGERHRVLVIDDGFDTSHPIFQGRILASYSLSCRQILPEYNADRSFEQRKRAFIDDILHPKVSCTANPGQTFRSSPSINNLVPRREEWNRGIQQKNLGDFTDSEQTLYRDTLRAKGEESRYSYHGTATASLIAYKNPRVDLVLLNISLSSGTPAPAESAPCPKQEEFDIEAAVLSDPEVVTTFSSAPDTGAQKVISELTSAHGVKFINMSFGRLSRLEIEQLLEQEGCSLDLVPYFRARGQLMAAAEKFRSVNNQNKSYLTFQASGNSGVRIDTELDSMDCNLEDAQTIMVGATDHNNRRTDWSNFGDCVPIAVPGSNVAVAAPQSFLNLASGTSFSAPIALRAATLVSNQNDSAQSIKEKLFSELDSRGLLPREQLPDELLFNNAAEIESFRLQQSAKRVPSKIPTLNSAFPGDRLLEGIIGRN